MARGSGFFIDEIPGQRWEIALGQLCEGGRLSVIPGEAPVGLERYVDGPRPDGRIHVSIFTDTTAKSVAAEMAQRDDKAL